MVVTLRQLRECICEVLAETAVTPADDEVSIGDIFLALVDNKWTPVKISGFKSGEDDKGDPDPNRILYKLKLLGSTRKVGQTRPAMSLRRVGSSLQGKTSKFGKKYSPIKGSKVG